VPDVEQRPDGDGAQLPVSPTARVGKRQWAIPYLFPIEPIVFRQCSPVPLGL